MKRFGRYQTVHELYSIGFTVVYSGRAQDNPEEIYAVKVFQPSAILLEEHRAQTETDLFLNSAQVQQKLTASKAQHWAPVHESGLSPNGAFYVTDKYDRSLQQLISGRVRITDQVMHAIIESVAKGLLELKQACDRPHGNLKASNILIADADNSSQTRIVLADPLPDPHIDTEVHWHTDLRAIAEFIYQLVMHRPAPTSIGWHVPDSKEWARLGKQAKDWRNLCNRLLNAHLKPDTMTIEILLDQLARLKVSRSAKTLRYIVAAALIVVAVVATVFVNRPEKSPTLENWRTLCKEYLTWIQPLTDEKEGLGIATKMMNRKPVKELWYPPEKNRHLQEWQTDKDLTRLFDEEINTAFYPKRVAIQMKAIDVWSEIIRNP